MPVNNNIRNLINNRPTLFQPSIVRAIVEDSDGSSIGNRENGENFTVTSLASTSSFLYNPDGSGLKSTQQLNVNWSEFSNHVFFNSAQVKVNAAIEKIIDYFPFDGNRKETEIFIDKLTGYEKYVLDNFPKNKGYLYFTGSNTYVSVADLAGTAFPEISKNVNAKPKLNPGTASATFEFHLWLPPTTNVNQTIFQKLSQSSGNFQGFSLFLSQSSAITSSSLFFVINSGSTTISSSFDVTKNQFNHIAVVWDRQNEISSASFYVNQVLVGATNKDLVGVLNFDSSNFYIGTGSAVTQFTPQSTLSGSIDEFRFWHKSVNKVDLALYAQKNIFAVDDLKLYFKFNEPSGINTNLVIDHSGNQLHGILTSSLAFPRNASTASLGILNPILYERELLNPILFPDHADLITFKNTLIFSASQYDDENPNIITKLIPKHYFLEGQSYYGFDDEMGPIATTIISSSLPNSAKMGETQAVISLLYTWATFFDEIKIYLDSFVDLNHVDYDQNSTVPDQFLQLLAEKYGITLPPLFSGASIEQFIYGENLDSGISTSENGLKYIQNQIWRRILINLKDIISSKGTIHSVKSFIRAVGIDPDNNFRIREYGGPSSRALTALRETKSEIAAKLSFSGSSIIKSQFLSGARIEPGYPYPVGTFQTDLNNRNTGTTNSSDGLYTSGNWSYEGTYRFLSGTAANHSLVRIHSTGSGGDWLLFNLVAEDSYKITLFGRPNLNVNALVLSLSLENSSLNLFDGNQWNINFGSKEATTENYSSFSSSFFIRAARQEYGDIVEEYTTSSWFDTTNPSKATDVLRNKSAVYNASGSFLVIGSQSIGSLTNFLNDSTLSNTVRQTAFTGSVAQIRFWSKALELQEWREHVRNFKSTGTRNILTNNVFSTTNSGSFEKLRLDVSCDQPTISSSADGTIILTDFSQNSMYFSGSGFLGSTSVITPERFYYSILSPKFDEGVTTNKIRVRSFQNLNNVFNDENQYAQKAPLYELSRQESPTDSNKFSIDFSIVDTLNQDIINIFATFDEISNAIGEPNLIYSFDYPNLEKLRTLYFNRLTEKINLKLFFEFFKWFDTNIGTFISQLLPRKTRFLGTNFIIENHMLERPKIQYYSDEAYLGETSRKSTPSYQTFADVGSRKF